MSFNVFIFRRDLRLVDNTGLNVLDQTNVPIWPVFIFNPLQVDSKRNPYYGSNCVQFMVESLLDLQTALRAKGSDLTLLNGTTEEVASALAHLCQGTIHSNQDYTAYARTRSAKIAKLCKAENVTYTESEDYMLLPLTVDITNGSGDPYVKFTPYYRTATQHRVAKPDAHVPKHLMSAEQQRKLVARLPASMRYDLTRAATLYQDNPNILHHGGRKAALPLLKTIGKRTNPYSTSRNFLDAHTSEMSAYNKFGCVSIREVYWQIRAQIAAGPSREGLLRQLYWRDFYYRIAWHNPDVLNPRKVANRNFQPKYGAVPWWSRLTSVHVAYRKPDRRALENFHAWCEGRTGIPIVDACMRQLNTTGFMHNRGRLIVSGFLIKNLHWSWEDGEMYFASKLYDYDPAQNSGGWQWSSGSGTDSQPYFRVLNPWRQSADYDSMAKYIKRWVPELATVPAKYIHEWYDYYLQIQGMGIKYPKPIVEIAESVAQTKQLYARGLH